MVRFALSSLVLVSSFAVMSAQEPSPPLRKTLKHDLFSAEPFTSGTSAPALQNQEGGSGRKSPALAALLSLAVPGLGEHYAGDFGAGKYLVAAEGALWITYAVFDVYGTSLRDDAHTFAAIHAGFDPAGKGDQFFVDVGNFINTQEFNEKRLQDRLPERLYDPNAGYRWQWDSDAARAEFKSKRISAETVLNNRKFVVAAVVVNHIVSAINAARLAISHNHALSESLGALDLRAEVMGGWANPHGIRFTFTRIF
ncbi:MAG: hypothetical protein C4326_08060 [Ignavibacteria bacterium]